LQSALVLQKFRQVQNFAVTLRREGLVAQICKIFCH
jgi:hypothetical protein